MADTNRIACGMFAGFRFAGAHQYRNIRFAVAYPGDYAIGRSDHSHPFAHRGHSCQPEISAGMPVVGKMAACIIAPAGARIVVEIILDKAVLPRCAENR